MIKYLFFITYFYLFLNLVNHYTKINFKELIILIVGFCVLDILTIDKDNITYLYYLIMISALILLTIIDLKEFWIPDLSFIAILIINIIKVLIDRFIYFKTLDLSGLFFAVIYIVFILGLSLIKKKVLMGFGDIKLIFALAIPLTILELGIMMIVSCLFALIIFMIRKTKKEDMIPFGPCLAVGFIVITFLECYFLN